MRLHLLLVLLTFAPVAAVQGEPAPDGRLLVTMPDDAVALMRQDMVAHLVAVDSVVARLAAGELAQAGAIARNELGTASMGRHRGEPNPPGRSMPREMHRLGITMHQAADRLAVAAEGGDMAAALSALREVTTQCVLCHAAYRVR